MQAAQNGIHPAAMCNLVNIVKANWPVASKAPPLLLKTEHTMSEGVPGSRTHTVHFTYSDGAVKSYDGSHWVTTLPKGKPNIFDGVGEVL